jgi:hypothetical protein
MADSSAITPSGTGKKTPLDILEELIAENKQAGGGAGAVDPATAPTKSPEQLAAEEAEQKKIQAQQFMEEQRIRDAQLLQEELAKMKDISAMPQTQAREQQDQQQEAAQQEKEEQLQGHQIIQLEHTKL